MSAPSPMLASSSVDWPGDTGWLLQPKSDGFRLLVAIGDNQRATAWSRHGTRLDDRVGDLLKPLRTMPAGTVLDGELIALADHDGRPVQDFSAVDEPFFATTPMPLPGCSSWPSTCSPLPATTSAPGP